MADRWWIPSNDGANSYLVRVLIECEQVFVVQADSVEEASEKANQYINLGYVTDDLSDWNVGSIEIEGPDGQIHY